MQKYSLTADAEAISRRAHQGQCRKHSVIPYIVHPERVALRLALRFPSDMTLAAAGWCYDVIEDCPQITREELRITIGDDAFAVVEEVTNPSKQHRDLTRGQCKAMDRAHIATISPRARCLKLVDRADNLRESCRCPDRGWIATYVRESRLLAEVLRGTDPELEHELHLSLSAAATAAGIV